MAQFDFWASSQDFQEILKAILETGDFAITPDLLLPTDAKRTFRAMEDGLMQAVARNGMLTVTGDFSGGELQFVERNSRGVQLIEVDSWQNLQVLSICAPYCAAGCAQLTKLASGFIMYPPLFGDKRRGISSPSEATKRAYRRITRIIKRHLYPWAHDPAVQIGQHGLALLEAQQGVVRRLGKWYDGQGRQVPKPLEPAEAPRPAGPPMVNLVILRSRS